MKINNKNYKIISSQLQTLFQCIVSPSTPAFVWLCVSFILSFFSLSGLLFCFFFHWRIVNTRVNTRKIMPSYTAKFNQWKSNGNQLRTEVKRCNSFLFCHKKENLEIIEFHLISMFHVNNEIHWESVWYISF